MIFIFGATLLAYRFFGKAGLFMMTVIATIIANIECLILVDAFGIEQTLGNVFFAVTFLITDILSENESKKEADKAVFLGIFTSVFVIIITQSWFLYTPSENDWVMPSVEGIFSNTPRTMIASLVVYGISQIIDVRLYHWWWKVTEKLSGNKKSFLWIRNNGSTMISQLINTVCFTLGAFYGRYDAKTIVEIIISTYLIYFVCAICDTPVIYLARKMKQNGKIK